MMLLRKQIYIKAGFARRKVHLMALVLNKVYNAANVRFRTRPQGHAGLSVLGVMTFRQVFNMPSKSCLAYMAAIAPAILLHSHH